MNSKLLVPLAIASDYLYRRGVSHGGDDALTEVLKTVSYYLRNLQGMVSQLYGGDITRDDFINKFVELLDGQLNRAWRAGMRDNGLDPVRDMTPQWSAQIQDIILKEFDYVERYADDILRARESGLSVDALKRRAQMWVNRYNEVQNEARIATAPGDKLLTWYLGPTHEHCSTCSSMAGQSMTAAQWQSWFSVGIKPQGRGLECGGWNCQCEVR